MQPSVGTRGTIAAHSAPFLHPMRRRDRPSAAQLRFSLFVSISGAILISVLLCHTPAAHSLNGSALLLHALLLVCIGAAAGASSLWFALPGGPHRHFAATALRAAPAWLWFPALMLFLAQGSLLALPLAGTIGVAAASASEALLHAQPTHVATGVATRLLPFGAGAGLAALFAYTALVLLFLGDLTAAAFCSALVTFCIAAAMPKRRTARHAFGRLAYRTALAVLCTALALLPALRSATTPATLQAALRSLLARQTAAVRPGTPHAVSSSDTDGYSAVLLWPFPPKKNRLTPVAPLRLGTHLRRQPLVIPFNGPYLYEHAGLRATGKPHIAHGTPLAVLVLSESDAPLRMQAQQTLAAAIPLACCAVIGMDVENADRRPGGLAAQMLLSGEHNGHTVQLALPVQTLQPLTGAGPRTQTLRFAIPAHSPLQSFDRIAVEFRPLAGASTRGARVSVLRFTLEPR